ncbi:helix-turn-helix transcriptional regulator [Meiothermus sp.]|uniref:ArsR/SmtB family transcription factor n=1 Tax=Meiothermus sp. TaxID=1955249 RepID=UPI0021DBBC87|nr:metalloregulator ArsR/SmtB family transcription factor [Meiothermus sp.]GIW33184.1 MAG: transcriptional regulator [Meiothermus sp.]
MNDELAIARLKALADPARLRLVRLLAELPDEHTVRDPRCGAALGACFCHLQERLGLAAPTVSHHLKVLREAGLIEVVRAGRWSYYRLQPAGLEGLLHDLETLRTSHRLHRLERAR